MARRDYSTGSIYQRKSDGRWLGTLEAGYTPSGTRRRITVTAKTEAEVKRKLRDKRLQIERAGQRSVKRSITVAAWSKKWLDMIQTEIRPSAYETDKAAMSWVVGTLGSIRLEDLTPEDVREVAARLRSARKSTSTALRYQGSLMRMLKAAIHDGYTVPPNVLLAKKPTKAVSDRRSLPLDESALCLKHLSASPGGSRWALAFLQGLRQGEALGLTWEQVDLDGGTLTVSWQLQTLRYRDEKDKSKGFRIPDGYEARHLHGSAHLVRPKSRKGWRVIPLTRWAEAALRAWREVAPDSPHGLVWPRSDGRPRGVAADRAEWAAIQDVLKVHHPSGRPYHVHEIRHSTATILMELGVPESVRVAIMGHSSITVTHGYEYVDVSQARLALEQVAERWQLIA